MKVKKEQQFLPVTITLESQEEVDKIHAIFSHVRICGLDPLYNKMFDELGKHFTEGYKKYFDKLAEAIE